MEDQSRNVMYAALRRILVSLSRLLLGHGVSFGEFAELAKQAYVEAAASDYGVRGRPASKSRIALLTGLSRKQVLRIQRTRPQTDDGLERRHNRNTRVISGWLQDPIFVDGDGQPAGLPLTGEHGSFETLVRRYSGDIPPKAVLRELKRLGVVEESDGTVTLLQHGYVPGHGGPEALAIFGSDTSALIDTIDHNLKAEGPGERLFQRKVSFPALSEAGVQRLRQLSFEDGQALLEKLDCLLAEYDPGKDVDDTVDAADTEPRYFAGLGIYMFRIRQPGNSPRRKP